MKELLSDAFPASAWRWGDGYLLEPGRRRLTRRDEPVDVEDRAFDLIVLLLLHHERALDRQEVIAAIWNKRPVSDATLRQLVYKARRAVGDDGEQQAVISTLYGRSLQWIAPVEMVFEASAAADAVPVTPSASSVSRLADVSAVAPPVAEPAPVAHRPRRWWPAAAVLACVIVGAAAWWGVHALRQSGSAAMVHMPRLAIEPFSNATGEGDLDWVRNGLPGLLGSLLGEAGGLDVVDSKQVAQAWQFKPTQGRNHEQQLRFATGADALVSGRLTKLADKVYELTLHVQPAQGDSADIRIDGERPGVLAADAVSRVRRRLGVAGRSAINSKLPSDPFLAEAFARGADLATQGKYADAQSYYALCVKGAPDYLPARFLLGNAQVMANDMQTGEKTLKDTLAMAQKRSDTRMAARVLFDLGLHEVNRGQASQGLRYLQQSVVYARHSGDAEFEIGAHFVAAAAAIKLNQPDVSARELDSGKRLLVQHPNFRKAQNLMYDVESIIAASTGDHAAMMSALRASLALNESLGNERPVVNSMNNLAAGLDVSGQPMDSVTVVLQAYRRAMQGQYRELEFQTADTLDDDLGKIGLEKQSLAASDGLLALARRENSKPWQVTVLHHVASAQLAQGNAADALASVRKAYSLIAPDDLNSDLYLDARMLEARAAFAAEPAALPQVSKQLDAYLAAHADNAASRDSMRAGFRRQKLVHALAYAAAGQPSMASASLRDASARQFRDGLDDSELREVALTIAITNDDKDAADIALDDFDVASTQSGRVLALYAKWAERIDDAVAASRAKARLSALGKQGLGALVAAGLDPNHPLDGPAAVAPGSGD